MERRKMLFVFNPNAGKAELAPRLFEVVDTFTKAGYQVTVHPTQCPMDGYEVIRDRCREFDLVAASGGDGTLNEAVSGLMDCGGPAPLFGYIPAGTVNDFAASLGIPREILPAAEAIAHGVPRPCDIGRFGERYFTYVAAFGAFTSVSYETPQQQKNLLGRPAYLLEGLRQLPTIHPYHMTVEYDGSTVEGDFIFGMVSNSTSVGGFSYAKGHDISMEDGLFELLLIRRPESLAQLNACITALLRKEPYNQDLIFAARTSRVRFLSRDEAPWTLDGEFGGAPAQVEAVNLRHALSILTPAPQPPEKLPAELPDI